MRTPLLSRAYLVDVDNFLIDTDTCQQHFIGQFGILSGNVITPRIYHDVYSAVRQERDGVSCEPDVARRLGETYNIPFWKTWHIFTHAPFQDFLIDGDKSLDFLTQLKTHGRVFLYSQSYKQNSYYQWNKLRVSGLSTKVGAENVRVEGDKVAALPPFLSELSRGGITDVTIMDDKASVLDAMSSLVDKLQLGSRVRYICKPFGIHAVEVSKFPDTIVVARTFDDVVRNVNSTHPEGRIRKEGDRF